MNASEIDVVTDGVIEDVIGAMDMAAAATADTNIL
jgi:hypothetical protein